MFKKITSGILVTGLLFSATGNAFAAQETKANNGEVTYASISFKAAENSKSHSLNQINSPGITTGTYVVQKVRETGGKIYMEAFPKGIFIPENQPKSIAGTFDKSQFVGLEKLRVGSEVSLVISVSGAKIYVL
ncbi:hypothetical protein ACTFSP_23815 [Bacillus cereus group sp. MYBK108-2]|uniref:Uncharacterized protein n=1 Tax=Bacillus cereus TaxID=1396 RepID=A0A9X8NTM1_BACCE|nr:hypothetical protein [Bacillus cereus]MRC29450.1 hypothetical protein [Bacillus thuringiensis]RWQ71119.1 hypothetical protein DR116_0025035 [Bacillus cereus]HDR8040732.1 hypothetical protein [Bacillus cereus]HEF1899653.1 hypothetical protein [Bacillus cereus]